MPDALLIVNASPLIFVGNAGHLQLLHTLRASRTIVRSASSVVGAADGGYVAVDAVIARVLRTAGIKS